ncbi:MAG: two-component system response regulator NarL [Pseudomonadales bacterium]|nr:two-component system response regulator NarL [Pseudomonadales bacterium]
MSDTEYIDVLIVDDHPLMRKGLADLLGLDEAIALAGEASNGEEALKLALQLSPDIILLDLNMPGMNGIETIKAMRSAGVDSRILVFTVSDDKKNLTDALKEGADGYLLKDMEPEDLIESIKKASRGETTISPELVSTLASVFKVRQVPEKNNINLLTDREKQVLKLVASGLTNKMIARKLNITEGTIKVHVKALLKKLGMRSRVEAAIWVTQNGK